MGMGGKSRAKNFVADNQKLQRGVKRQKGILEIQNVWELRGGEGMGNKRSRSKKRLKKTCSVCNERKKSVMQIDEKRWICEDCAQYMSDLGHSLSIE